MTSIGGDGPVDLGDIGVEFARFIGGETKTGEIQTVAHRNIVGQGVALQDAQDGLARSDALRIHRTDLVGRQADGRSVIGEVVDVSLPQIGGRHGAHDALRLAITASFIVGEEKQTVSLDRATERAAKDIADELGRIVGRTIAQFRLFNKVVVGTGVGVAVVFIGRTMKIIGAAFCYQCNLCARRKSSIRI